MIKKNILLPILLISSFFVYACVYIVLPEGLESSGSAGKSSGWSAIVTGINQTDAGDWQITLTIRNETGDWSAMEAIEGKPAEISSGGKASICNKVYVTTGKHRLAPGFQMRGYTAGLKTELMTQLIYVECQAAEIDKNSMLSIPYSYVTGQYNYYEQGKNKVDDKLVISLDKVETDLTYPVAESIDGLIQKPETEIVALNKVVLTLTNVQRVEKGLQFSWQTSNPGEYQTYVHIGNPPVIGDDGILYGYYETPDIVDAPITPAGSEARWTTDVAVPNEVKSLYILLSVESGKARLFANYAIDINDE